VEDRATLESDLSATVSGYTTGQKPKGAALFGSAQLAAEKAKNSSAHRN